jgi:hypothetical protein
LSSLADAGSLTDPGFTKCLTTRMSESIQGYAWFTTFIVLGILYV